MFIPKIMTSVGLLICIISANQQKLQGFTSFQFSYDGIWSEEHVSSKKLFNKRSGDHLLDTVWGLRTMKMKG